jgi:hypothetical protein
MHFNGGGFCQAARRGIRTGGRAECHQAHLAQTLPGIGASGYALQKTLENGVIFPVH